VTERLDALFGALADPTRRHIVERLVADGPISATDLATGLPITRQAVVKHLQVLAGAGLVDAERAGREVRYGAAPTALSEAERWLDRTAAAWDRRLARLRARLEG
jgi:DNA-binding transcriptional ArsR family regulator